MALQQMHAGAARALARPAAGSSTRAATIRIAGCSDRRCLFASTPMNSEDAAMPAKAPKNNEAPSTRIRPLLPPRLPARTPPRTPAAAPNSSTINGNRNMPSASSSPIDIRQLPPQQLDAALKSAFPRPPPGLAGRPASNAQPSPSPAAWPRQPTPSPSLTSQLPPSSLGTDPARAAPKNESDIYPGRMIDLSTKWGSGSWNNDASRGTNRRPPQQHQQQFNSQYPSSRSGVKRSTQGFAPGSSDRRHQQSQNQRQPFNDPDRRQFKKHNEDGPSTKTDSGDDKFMSTDIDSVSLAGDLGINDRSGQDGMTGNSKMSSKERDRKRREREQERKAVENEKRLAAKQAKAEKFGSDKSEESRAQKPKDVYLYDGITIANLSTLMCLRYERLAATMRKLGFEHVDADYIINADTASLIVLEHNMNPIMVETEVVKLNPRPTPEDWSVFPARPPVVTIMGHVDHGKTTLLDSLRKTAVAANEAGGITQHIGAFSVLVPSSGQRITFLDTPGHAAFSAMRGRGAHTTDIVVLVVASDDGVMPQTAEAIKHAQAADAPIVVALNKCDKPDVRLRETKEALMQAGVQIEEYGGDVPAVPVSGLTGKGLDNLEEAILAVAEMLDIRGDPTGPVEAFVIESRLSRERGNVTTVIVRRGTLTPGTVLVAGTTWCKVRQLVDESGKEITSAGPSTPVEITGWKSLPQAGDLSLQAENEHHAKQVVQSRRQYAEHLENIESIKDINEKRQREKTLHAESVANNGKPQHTTTTSSSDDTGILELRLIVKADVHGSLEAIESIIQGLPSHEVVPKLVSTGVGPITETDIDMASTTNSEIIAFNVPCDRARLNKALSKQVKIHQHKIIYNLIDSIKEMMCDVLPPETIIDVQGEAEVLQVFEVTTRGKNVEPIAGCRVINGKVLRSSDIRVLRNREIVHTGTLKTFKHHKKDIHEASKGLECGIAIDQFTDYQAGDVIQAFKITKKRRTSL